MSLITTKGLIIKEDKVGENDRLITILTSDNGIIRAFAPNALKLRSQNISATQLLSYSRLVIYKGRDTYKVNEAQSIEIFFDLRYQIEALALAGYFCELLYDLAPKEDDGDAFLRLALNCLSFLCSGKVKRELLKSIFELKICQYAGYMPDLSCCCACKQDDIKNVWFDPYAGVVYCENCKPSPRAFRISNSVFAAMRHILYTQGAKLFAFDLKNGAENELSKVSETFVRIQTDREFKTLVYYNSINH